MRYVILVKFTFAFLFLSEVIFLDVYNVVYVMWTVIPGPLTNASLVAQTVGVCLQCRRPGFNPWVGKISRRRKWQPTPVFWKIPWMEEPGRLQFMGSQRVGCDWATSLLFFSAVLYNIVHQETRAHWECYSWKKTLHRDCQLVPLSIHKLPLFHLDHD